MAGATPPPGAGGSSPIAVGSSRMRYNRATQRMQVSMNGGPWVDLP